MASRLCTARSRSWRRLGYAGAAISWRVSAARSSPCQERWSVCARGRAIEEAATLVLAAVDPAQPYGAVLPWPRRGPHRRRPARVAGAYVVFVAHEPVLYLERGGRGILTLDRPSRRRLRGVARAGGRRTRRARGHGGARANRRRVGDRLGSGARSGRARLSPGSAETYAPSLNRSTLSNKIELETSRILGMG